MATTLVARSPSPHRNAGNPPREPESPPPLLAALASLSMSASPVPVSSSPDSVKQWKIPTMPPMQRIAVPIIVPPPPTAGSPPIISVPQQPPLSPMQMTEAHTQSSLEEEHLPRHGHRHRHKHTHPSSDNALPIPVTVRGPDQEQVQVVVEATPETTVSEFVRETQRLLSKSSLSWIPEISFFAPDSSVTSHSEKISMESPIFDLLSGTEFALEVFTQDEFSRQMNSRPTTLAVPSDILAHISAAAAQCLALANNESASGSAGAGGNSSSSSRSSSPSLSPPWGNHISPPSSPEGFGRKRSRAPCMFDYSLIDVPDGSRRIVPNTSCHRCKTRKPQCLVCPLNEKHKFCLVCLERHHNMVVIPPSGCPLCTQSCTCAMCRKKY